MMSNTTLCCNASNPCTETSQKQTLTPVFVPHVDIYETDEQIVLLADMPGLSESQADVTLDRNLLTIRGQVQATPPEGYRRVHTEYEVGQFERSFTLPNDVDREHVEARVQNGVLRVVLPKQKAVGPQKIAVKSAE